MKRFIGTIFTLLVLAAPASLAKDSTQEKDLHFAQENQWRLIMAHMLAYQPAAVGWERFADAMEIKPHLPEWKAIARDAKRVKNWPSMVAEGNTLRIVETGYPDLTVEVVFGEKPMVKMNGRIFTPSGKRPLREELQKFLAVDGGGKEASRGFSLFPEAVAEEWPRGRTTTIGVAGVVLVYAATVGIIRNITNPKGMAAAVAGGLAIQVGHVACGETADSAAYDVSSFVSRYGACWATPLSWINANPFDRLYLKDLECRDDYFEVKVQSPNGKQETRHFVRNKDGSLESVQVSADEIASLKVSPDGKRFESGDTDIQFKGGAKGYLTRPKHKKILDRAQSLFRDFEFYKGLCEDEPRRKELLRLIALGAQRGEHAYDDKTPEQLNRKAE